MDGSEAIARLQQTAQQLSREKQRLDGEASELETHVSELIRQRGAALLELAQHYLPDLKRSTIEATLADIRQELVDVLAKREARERDCAAAAERVGGQLVQLQSQLATVTETLNGLVRQRESLEPVVAAQLAQHPKFPELAKLAEQARVALKRNQSRVAELQQSAKEKLPAYERSELFLYLHRRQFGTPQYASTGWTRALDRWVGRLIDYPQARRGYEFLRRSPEVLSKELERRQQEFDALVTEMQAIEGEAANAAGLTAVREQGTDCGRQRDSLVAQIQQRQSELHGIQAELQQLIAGQSQYYQEALQRIQRFLGDTKASVLEARAKQTPEPDDDRVVANINTLTNEVEQSKPRLEELNQGRQLTSERLRGVEQILGRCRQQNFDSTRSYFEPPFDFDNLLSRFTAGDMSSDDLWRTMRSQQRFQPTATSQLGGVVADAMNNRILLNVALQVTVAVLEAAARSTSGQGGIFGGRSSHHGSSGGGTWSGGTSSGGGSWSGGGPSHGGGASSGGGGSSTGGDSGGSFTSGEGF